MHFEPSLVNEFGCCWFTDYLTKELYHWETTSCKRNYDTDDKHYRENFHTKDLHRFLMQRSSVFKSSSSFHPSFISNTAPGRKSRKDPVLGRILHRILAGLHNRERLTGSYQGARLVGSYKGPYQGGKVGRILHRILSERKVGRILHHSFTDLNFL